MRRELVRYVTQVNGVKTPPMHVGIRKRVALTGIETRLAVANDSITLQEAVCGLSRMGNTRRPRARQILSLAITLDGLRRRWYDSLLRSSRPGQRFTSPAKEGRDVIANAPNTERARADSRHGSPPSPHTRTDLRGLAEFVSDESAVLWIGVIGDEAARALEGRGCRVQIVSVIDGENQDTPDLDRFEFGRARFDVVIAADSLGRVARPELLLAALRKSLRTDGRLIATVPNAGHPAVRDAIGRGESPYVSEGPIDPGQLRLFTGESLCEAIERADFVVGRLNGIADLRGTDIASWSIIALPLPVPGLERLQAQFRDCATEQDNAERTTSTLRAMLVETRRVLDAAHLRADFFANQGREARATILELQRALVDRDREFEETIRDHFAKIEEIEPLKHASDAAHRHALAAEARCRSLELRIEHIVMEIPRRFARKLRSALFGKRSNPK